MRLLMKKNRTLFALSTAVLAASLFCSGLMLVSQAQVSTEMPKLKNQEFDSISQIMDIIDHTNVHHIDKASFQSFQSYLDMKNATDAHQTLPRISAHTHRTPAIKPIHGLQAPPAFDQKAF